MLYLTDTHALVWHLTDDDRLGDGAREVLRAADEGLEEVAVPTTCWRRRSTSRGRGGLPFDEVMERMEGGSGYGSYPLTVRVIWEMTGLYGDYSIHDSAIVATARILGTDLLTRDGEIVVAGDVDTVWD